MKLSGGRSVLTLPGQNIRYFYICLFLALLPLPMILIEQGFIATGSGLSVLDGRGSGQITLYGASLFFVVVYSRYVAQDSPFFYLDLYRKAWSRALLGFLTFCLVSCFLSIIGFVMTIGMNTVSYSPEAISQLNQTHLKRLLISLPIASVLALVEELMFRGFLMRYLRWKVTPLTTVLAIVFASLVFAFVHNLPDPVSWIEPRNIRLFIGLFILGCVLCVVYISTGSLLCSVGLHAGFLFMENARNYTKVLQLSNAEWFMVDGQDVRTSPIAWGLFCFIGLAVYLNRRRLHPIFAVEKQVMASSDVTEPIGSGSSEHTMAARAGG